MAGKAGAAGWTKTWKEKGPFRFARKKKARKRAEVNKEREGTKKKKLLLIHLLYYPRRRLSQTMENEKMPQRTKGGWKEKKVAFF